MHLEARPEGSTSTEQSWGMICFRCSLGYVSTYLTQNVGMLSWCSLILMIWRVHEKRAATFEVSLSEIWLHDLFSGIAWRKERCLQRMQCTQYTNCTQCMSCDIVGIVYNGYVHRTIAYSFAQAYHAYNVNDVGNVYHV